MPNADSSVLLTVRGKSIPPTLDAARVLHNETAGATQGIAAARSLGDLSHTVYAPVAGEMSSAKPGEILFLDTWDNPQGIMEFFSNKAVQEQAGKLFSARDATVWMPAKGAFTYHLQAPAGRNERYIGMIRCRVASPEATIEALGALASSKRRDGRRRGLLSHEVFVKMNAPGDTSPVEVLGLDVWCDAKGMAEHYSDSAAMAGLARTFTAPPDASIWEQAQGPWSEW